MHRNLLYTSVSPYIPPLLEATTHVFVRRDAVRTPLQRSYDGPYRIIKRSDKFYTLDLNVRRDTASLDRLKAAVFEDPLPDSIPDCVVPSIAVSATSSHRMTPPAAVNNECSLSFRLPPFPGLLR